MSDAPVDVVVAAFNSEDGAQSALEELKAARKEGLINIKDVALLYRDDKNELHIKESGDHGFGRGALIGGVAGAVVGALAGPVGWVTVGGAAIGGLAAKMRDAGIPDSRLKQMGESLKPGSSALVAVIEHQWVITVENRLRELAADVITESISADIADQLEKQAESSGPTAVPPTATETEAGKGETKAA